MALATLGAGCGEYYYDTGEPRSNPPVPHYIFSLNFPAKAFFRPDTNTILLINRADLGKMQLSLPDMETAAAGAYTALKYAGEQLSQLPHVRIINLTDSLNFSLTTDSVAALANRYHADYTLALVAYRDSVSFVSTYLNRDYYDNMVNLKFTMYLGKGDLYKNLPGADTLRSKWRVREIIATEQAHQTVDLGKDYIIGASENAAFNALRDYLPYNETESRPLYANAKLAPVANAIMAGRLDQAIQLSQPLLNDVNPVVASQAAYNLAVVYESQGDLDKAMNMAELAISKSKSRYAGALIAYIKSK